jgi:hypothetical protein
MIEVYLRYPTRMLTSGYLTLMENILELTGSQIRDLLEVPKNYRIISAVAIGFPSEKPRHRPRKGLNEIAFLNKHARKWSSERSRL